MYTETMFLFECEDLGGSPAEKEGEEEEKSEIKHSIQLWRLKS
jgi:hypothetical protein